MYLSNVKVLGVNCLFLILGIFLLSPGSVYFDRQASGTADIRSESLVIGALISGRFNQKGFSEIELGVVSEEGRSYTISEISHLQYDILYEQQRTDLRTAKWTNYDSRSSLSAKFWFGVCTALDQLGFGCHTNSLFWVNSIIFFFTILVFANIIVKIHPVYGLVFFGLVIANTNFVARFSDNLYWSPWVYFIPAIAAAVDNYWVSPRYRYLNPVYSCGILFFCLWGFEYITVAVALALWLIITNISTLASMIRRLLGFAATTILAFGSVVFMLGAPKILEKASANSSSTFESALIDPTLFATKRDAFWVNLEMLVQKDTLIQSFFVILFVMLFQLYRMRKGASPSRIATNSTLGALAAIFGSGAWIYLMDRHALMHYWITPFILELILVPLVVGAAATLVFELILDIPPMLRYCVRLPLVMPLFFVKSWRVVSSTLQRK